MKLVLQLLPAIGLGLAIAVSNGLARFAYALLLPAMREDMAWSYAQSGWLNTANALGYVAGAISGYILLRHMKATRLFVVGLLLCVGTLGITGLSANLAWLSSSRILSGIGAAWVFSCGGALIQHLYIDAQRIRGIATGLYFGSAGLGIVASGLLLNPFLAYFGNGSWPYAWLILGLLGSVFALWPLSLARGLALKPHAALAASREHLSYRHLWSSLVAYFLYACGYIIYMTFVIAWIREKNFDWTNTTLVWTLLGLGIAVSPFLWRHALEHGEAERTFSTSCLVTLLGTGVLLLGDGLGTLLASSVIYSLGIFIVPTAIAVLLRRSLPLALLPRGMALFTSVFAIGQAIGPVAAGRIADLYSLEMAVWMSIGLLAMAAVLPLIGGGKSDNSNEATQT